MSRWHRAFIPLRVLFWARGRRFYYLQPRSRSLATLSDDFLFWMRNVPEHSSLDSRSQSARIHSGILTQFQYTRFEASRRDTRSGGANAWGSDMLLTCACKVGT